MIDLTAPVCSIVNDIMDYFYKIFFNAFLASNFFLFLNFITKGRGMGLGDVKLVAAMGLFFWDWKGLVVWLMVSFFVGAFVGIALLLSGKAKLGKQIPFGPFLIVSFFVMLFGGDILVGIFLPYF